MTSSSRWIQLVVQKPDSESSGDRKEEILLPPNAGIVELLRALEASGSPLYEDVRKRILRLSGDVLAFGRERPDLHTLRDQLANGGPVILPEESPDTV